MKSLGIYFGQNVINIVEVDSRKIINNIQVSLVNVNSDILESKVPEELKTISLLKEELRKNKIENKEATICLSGEDLIIRNFEMPLLSGAEMASAVSFEAKKYIPFKIEEVIFSFQAQADKANRKNLVLFAGIKKESLERYFSILLQLGIKVSAIEYAPFSLLRLLKLTSLDDKGVIGIIDSNSEEEQESTFIVVENGFPLFSRDVKLSSTAYLKEAKETTDAGNEAQGMALEKLKTEIRISLDYYNRKFPLKKIEQIYFLGSSEARENIEIFIKELALPFKYADAARLLSKQQPFNLSFFKAYSSALAPAVASSIKVNIVSAWEKSKQAKEAPAQPKEIFSHLLSSGFKPDFRAVSLAIAVCLIAFFGGFLQRLPLQKEVKVIIASRPGVANIDNKAKLETLSQAQSQVRKDIIVMEDLLKKQLYLTPELSALPALIPEGLWLQGFTFSNTDKHAEFGIDGIAKLGDSSKELLLINNLLIAIKKNPDFKAFSEIKLNSVDSQKLKGDTTVTHFMISGQT